MKLKEAMGQTGTHALTSPGSNINVQVVQPRTRQAHDDSQSGEGYEKVKKRNQKTRKNNDIEDYNTIDTDELDHYYDYESETDNEITKRIKKLSKKEKKKEDED